MYIYSLLDTIRIPSKKVICIFFEGHSEHLSAVVESINPSLYFALKLSLGSLVNKELFGGLFYLMKLAGTLK